MKIFDTIQPPLTTFLAYPGNWLVVARRTLWCLGTNIFINKTTAKQQSVLPYIAHITVCAVAHHCYNGDVSFPWEKWKIWHPVKSKPLNRLTHNLSVFIKSTRGTFVPNLVKIRSRGTSGQMGEVQLYVWLFIFFSRTNVEKRLLDGLWRAMAQKTRNRARMCLYGVIKWKKWNLTPLYPQNRKNWPWIGSFQPNDETWNSQYVRKYWTNRDEHLTQC